jgi:hypothetical protein
VTAILALTLALSATPSLWQQLESADAVVRVRVVRVDKAGAAVEVLERLKGEVPDSLVLPAEATDGTCFPAPALSAGTDAVVLLARTESVLADTRARNPDLASMLDDAARRQPWQYAGARLGEQATPLVRQALERLAQGEQGPTEEWALALFNTRGLRTEALEVLERDLPRSPRILREVENWVLSRTTHPLFVTAALRLLAQSPNANVTAAAADVLELALAQGWDVVSNETVALLAAREGLAPPEGAGPRARFAQWKLARANKR